MSLLVRFSVANSSLEHDRKKDSLMANVKDCHARCIHQQSKSWYGRRVRSFAQKTRQTRKEVFVGSLHQISSLNPLAVFSQFSKQRDWLLANDNRTDEDDALCVSGPYKPFTSAESAFAETATKATAQQVSTINLVSAGVCSQTYHNTMAINVFQLPSQPQRKTLGASLFQLPGEGKIPRAVFGG